MKFFTAVIEKSPDTGTFSTPSQRIELVAFFKI
jgi:hypothetical protein